MEGRAEDPAEVQQEEQIKKEKIIDVQGPGGGTALRWVRTRREFKLGF